jgi:hypothetical protein
MVAVAVAELAEPAGKLQRQIQELVESVELVLLLALF